MRHCMTSLGGAHEVIAANPFALRTMSLLGETIEERIDVVAAYAP